MVDYECKCPKCKEEIVIDVDDDWIEEIASGWGEARREGMREAYD